MQVGEALAQGADELGDLTFLFKGDLDEDPHCHRVEYLVERVAEFVDSAILRAIDLEHAIIRPLALVLLLVLSGMVETLSIHRAWRGCDTNTKHSGAQERTRDSDSASMLDTHTHTRTQAHTHTCTHAHMYTRTQRIPPAFDAGFVHRVPEHPRVA